MELLEAKDTLLRALPAVHKEIMKWFRSDFKVEKKSDASPVTIADKNAEEMLRKKICKSFPDHGIIGEEFGNENASKEWVWTIDPIDGTRSFVRGLPLFSTLLSLLHRGEPVLGIISFPALGEVAWAVQGQGAFCNGAPLTVSNQTRLDRAFVGTADVYCFREKKYLKLLNALHKEADIVRTYPDAFGHMMAIRGAVDVMVDPWAFIWDFAPCKILAEEAGGKFMNFTKNANSISEGTAIVGNPRLVRAIRKLIEKK